MKLKFTPEAQEVINTISALPNIAVNEEDFDKPFKAVQSLSQKLIHMTGVGNKMWAKIRRELSFFYSLQHAGEKRTEDKAQRYTDMVKCVKAMKDETSLQSVPFIRVALNYGVLRLSDFEIETLIKYNKI